jgi:hypothetical protein
MSNRQGLSRRRAAGDYAIGGRRERGNRRILGATTIQHEKTMPVILRTPEEIDVWMNAPAQVAFELQRPLPSDALKIVLRDSKEDAFAA